jgi:hypothetical protein
MNSLGIAGITLGCSIAGLVVGVWARDRLPDHHVRDDSKDAIKNATGMIATLVALVIGLLVSSSKSTFDQASSGMTQAGAKLITLDGLLARYGPEAAEARSVLKNGVAEAIERFRPTTDDSPKMDIATIGAAPGLEAAYDRIRALTPVDDSQRALKATALQLCGDVIQVRWLMIEGAQAGLPTVFLVVLAFWLTVLFAGLGLQAPNNLTAKGALFLCALSMAGAVFLILELSRPMEGTIKISEAPLRKAMAVLGK